MESIFITALRGKFKFPHQGQINVEDLWQLTLPKLDNVYKTLNSELKETKEESLLDTKSAKDIELELKIDIVKYIVKVKQDENKAREDAIAKKEELNYLLDLLDKKEKEADQSLTPEQIRKKIAELKS